MLRNTATMLALLLLVVTFFLIARSSSSANASELDGGQHAMKLPWEKAHPERKAWSNALMSDLSDHLASFGSARDIGSFCPNYARLSAADRVWVIATIAVAIAKFESNFNPRQHFGEPPPLGYDSIGLFQLSYEDGFKWCRMNRAAKSLEDPVTNIACTVPEMARLVATDRVLAAGTNSRNTRGLARYWSVVRRGEKHHLGEIRAMATALPHCK